MAKRDERTTVVAFRTSEITALRFKLNYPYFRERSRILRELLNQLLDGKLPAPIITRNKK